MKWYLIKKRRVMQLVNWNIWHKPLHMLLSCANLNYFYKIQNLTALHFHFKILVNTFPNTLRFKKINIFILKYWLMYSVVVGISDFDTSYLKYNLNVYLFEKKKHVFRNNKIFYFCLLYYLTIFIQRCQPLRNTLTSILKWKYLSSWIAEF